MVVPSVVQRVRVLLTSCLPFAHLSGGESRTAARGFRRAARVTAESLPRGASREADYWVPSDAYSIANDFRHLHMPTLAMDHFAELLLRLNRVWKVRRPRGRPPSHNA